jgi:hypothetical protein
MAKNSNKYIFKYNKNNELYNYIELNKADKVLSYFKIEDKTLIRFDRKSDIKQLIQFNSKIKLKQKFISGESFITVFDSDTDECVQYNMPSKEKQIVLVNNNISVSDFGKFVVKRWKQIMGESIETNENLTINTSNTINSPINLRYKLIAKEYWPR